MMPEPFSEMTGLPTHERRVSWEVCIPTVELGNADRCPMVAGKIVAPVTEQINAMKRPGTLKPVYQTAAHERVDLILCVELVADLGVTIT